MAEGVSSRISALPQPIARSAHCPGDRMAEWGTPAPPTRRAGRARGSPGVPRTLLPTARRTKTLVCRDARSSSPARQRSGSRPAGRAQLRSRDEGRASLPLVPTPARTTATAFPRYAAGRAVADSASLHWKWLFVRRYRFSRVVDRFLVPATPEPLISCSIAGSAQSASVRSAVGQVSRAFVSLGRLAPRSLGSSSEDRPVVSNAGPCFGADLFTPESPRGGRRPIEFHRPKRDTAEETKPSALSAAGKSTHSQPGSLRFASLPSST